MRRAAAAVDGRPGKPWKSPREMSAGKCKQHAAPAEQPRDKEPCRAHFSARWLDGETFPGEAMAIIRTGETGASLQCCLLPSSLL